MCQTRVDTGVCQTRVDTGVCVCFRRVLIQGCMCETIVDTGVCVCLCVRRGLMQVCVWQTRVDTGMCVRRGLIQVCVSDECRCRCVCQTRVDTGVCVIGCAGAGLLPGVRSPHLHPQHQPGRGGQHPDRPAAPPPTQP